MGVVQIHFDGDIATNHQVSMRTLAKTLTHLQNSIDRAYLEDRNGKLWKYAKMRQAYHYDVELLVQEPKEGGYVLDFLTSNPLTLNIIDRVSSAINSAVNDAKQDGLQKALKLEESVRDRIVQVEQGILTPRDFNDIIENPDVSVIRRYGDRAISREIDQILTLIRAGSAGDSTFELALTGSKNTQIFEFNKKTATAFHNTVTKKALGEPVIYKAQLSQMDKFNKSAKIVNKDSDSVANLFFINKEMLNSVIPFFETDSEFLFYGSPFIEYGAFDPIAGDIYFLGLCDG